MIELKLTVQHFSELVRKGYSLDMVFLLKLLGETDEAYPNNPKIDNIIQTMERKGLITEKDELTEEGKSLLSFISSTENSPKIPRKKRIVTEDVFERWWKAYPSSDTFDYKNKKFKGTRALRVKKDDCKAEIDKILKKGEYTIDELVSALKLESYQKAENSVKTGQNKMSYFQNSLTYLKQGTYDAFVDLVRKGHKVEEEKTTSWGGVAI